MNDRGSTRVAARAGLRSLPRRGDGGRSHLLGDRVLRRIWREREISRAEIARQAELSRSTVSEIVGALLRTRLVAELGTGPSSGGRRPIVLQFQDNAAVILGVEMGATHVAVGVTNLRGHVLAWKQRDHPVRSDPDGARALVRRLCDECLSRSAHDRNALVGIGVAVPSPVDPERPGHLSELVLPAWKGHSGLEMLSAHYRVPVFVDNDANLGALAEHWWGAAMGLRNFAYIKIATGIGSGHVIDGEIYRGATGVAGEIGHMAIDSHGEECICGLRGCLATFIGAPALEKRARALLPEFPDSVLARVTPTIEVIENEALNGDALALQVSREAAEFLGTAVAGMLNLMNPSAVIIGGGLARLGELLIEPLRETVGQRTLVSSVTASEIRTSELGPRAVAIGAATLVLKAALDDPSLFPVVESGAEAAR